MVNHITYRNALYKRYEEYITDVLRYAASNIDVDDMKVCLSTLNKSEKFNKVQEIFDNIKDTHNIDFIYMIIPQNESGYDNIMNVIAGMSTYEKMYVPENEVTLGGLTGDDYSAETASKYYRAVNQTGEITFFEESAKWGSDYTGILPLYDSDGNYFAELCVDVPTSEIQDVIRYHVLYDVLVIVGIGIVFTVLFLAWTRRAITNPIQIIESRVVEFARQSHGQTDPKALIIDMPDIRTRNELQSLSKAIKKLSEDMRNYLINALAAQDEAKTANQKAIEMGEQAIRDSLTGIRNRNAYDAEVKKIGFKIGSESFTKFGIAVVDLNFLKRINDTFGHEKGNEAIRKICMITCKTFSHSPVFRIGGDEFAVILENDDYDHIEERINHFQRVLEDIRDDNLLEPWEQVSAAIGWSKFNPDIDGNVDNVFKRADHKMYENKKAMKAARE